LFFNKRLFFDSLINIFISQNFYNLSFRIFVVFDKGLLEYFGPMSVTLFFQKNYSVFKKFVSLNLIFCVHFTLLTILLVAVYLVVFLQVRW
jgi:hypothetical protein